LLTPFADAVIFTVVFADTAFACSVNVPTVCPAGITIVATTVAACVLSLTSWIVAPPVVAGLSSVTVPVAEAPDFTEAGRLMLSTPGACTSSPANAFIPGTVASNVTGVLVATALVPTENWTLVCPADTTTLAGKVTDATLLESAIVLPEAGAGPARVTVPVAALPPRVEAADRVKV
jgi:hypothetical protein